MRAYPLLGEVGGGWALVLEFFGPQMALAYRFDAISSQGPKTLEFQGPTPPTSPRNEYARIQNIMQGAV
jgi:hypothetical protein